MKKTWLFLDFDNTLMKTEQYAVPSLIARFNALYAEQIGRNLTWEEFKCHFHGQARETLCTNLSQYFGINVDYSLLYDAREWRMMQHLQQVSGGIPMAPHLISVLTQLKDQKIGLALVTNNPLQRAFTAMRFADNAKGDVLAQLFSTHFFEAGDVQKPKPDVYLRAMAQVSADSTCSFAVEDSLTGAASAIAGGLTTFGFTGFADDPEKMKQQLLETGCKSVFHCWSLFLPMLKELSAL